MVLILATFCIGLLLAFYIARVMRVRKSYLPLGVAFVAGAVSAAPMRYLELHTTPMPNISIASAPLAALLFGPIIEQVILTITFLLLWRCFEAHVIRDAPKTGAFTLILVLALGEATAENVVYMIYTPLPVATFIGRNTFDLLVTFAMSLPLAKAVQHAQTNAKHLFSEAVAIGTSIGIVIHIFFDLSVQHAVITLAGISPFLMLLEDIGALLVCLLIAILPLFGSLRAIWRNRKLQM